MNENLLRKRQKELLIALEDIKLSARPVDLNEPMGRLSRMDAIQHQQMALKAKSQIETNLKLCEQAIERWESGDYGICLSCEEVIDEKRLKAKPEAAFCTRCQK